MESVKLRLATLEDLMLLYKWANDPVVRENSFNTKNISLDEHKKWFEKSLTDDNVKIFILIIDDIPVGQVRLLINNTSQLIDYSIDVDSRGKGYGEKILTLVESNCNRNLPLVGQVKFENIPSQKIFEKLGYKRILKENYFEYIKSPNFGDGSI